MREHTTEHDEGAQADRKSLLEGVNWGVAIAIVFYALILLQLLRISL